MSTTDTLKGLIRHATKYGTEGVMEAAAESWRHFELTTEEVVGLQQVIDKLDAEPRQIGRSFTKVRNHRIPAEERVNRLLGINTEEEE